MAPDGHLIRLELPSSFELLDLVQLLSDRLSAIAGLDEDATHWVSVAFASRSLIVKRQP